LNNYFIFKKVRDVNAEQVSRLLIDRSPQADKEVAADESKINLVLSKKKAKRPRVKKIKSKIKIGQQVPQLQIVVPVLPEAKAEEPVVAIAPGQRIKIKKKKGKIKVKAKAKRRARVKVKSDD
jgi:hypothetical protein